MKKIGKNNLTKQIIYIVIVLMLCNFIMPTYSYAVETEDGGSLMEVFAQFLCMLPDVVIEFLQDMFVTPDPIKVDDETYSIRYSPGIIFSGDVPALDINFINPGESKIGIKTSTEHVSVVEALETKGAIKNNEKEYSMLTISQVLKEMKESNISEDAEEIDINSLGGNLKSTEQEEPEMNWDTGEPLTTSESTTQEIIYGWQEGTTIYVIVDSQYLKIDNNLPVSELYKYMIYEVASIEDLKQATSIINTVTRIEVGSKEYESSAGILQPIVATWYNALRRIAIVGLLSVIVYIGIRILLTSTSAKDKAKYKKMLKDWLVALCLIFVLHYIMSITITVVNKINEVVKASSISAKGEDILMTAVRNRIFNLDSWSEALTYVVIYDVLVVYTIIYTIQYIKRIIYIAFLTMIAPLITLTYPLDKIKDNKSQAFDMWIKDYIFFSLIQVVHLLIYYIFLGTTVNLAIEGNWIFAVVAIGFIVPAEKLIKKMFGFEKSKNLGAMAAGATGALVMNAMKKIPSIGKGSSGGGKASSQEGGNSGKLVRTAGVNPFVNFGDEITETGTSGSTAHATSGASRSSSTSGGNTASLGSGNSSQAGSNVKNGKEQESKLASLLKRKGLTKDKSKALTSSEIKRPKRRVVRGAIAVAGRYFAPVAGGTIRFMAGTTGAIIGFSAGVAQGDAGKAFSGMAIGATAGTKIAQKAGETVKKTEKVPEKIGHVVDTYRAGIYGEEAVQNAKFDKVFRNSQEYEELKKFSELPQKEFDRKVQKMLNLGIKDAKKMKQILKNNKKDSNRYSIDKAIMFSKMADKCSEDILYDQNKFIKFCEDKNIDISKSDLNELRKDIINFK